MRVIETKLATEIPGPQHLPMWLRVLKKVVPLANPDFENHYQHVCKWWVEVDDSGAPQRELGFDVQNIPIVAGPIGRNFGFWTDSNMKFVPDEHAGISRQEFESMWANFEARRQQEGEAGRHQAG
ncbi:MAG: hypothetical protein FJW30_04090 [Acidobacteria bacterium]|nr:hypothetical protein [Acidobacteriota bacterium]